MYRLHKVLGSEDVYRRLVEVVFQSADVAVAVASMLLSATARDEFHCPWRANAPAVREIALALRRFAFEQQL